MYASDVTYKFNFLLLILNLCMPITLVTCMENFVIKSIGGLYDVIGEKLKKDIDVEVKEDFKLKLNKNETRRKDKN